MKNRNIYKIIQIILIILLLAASGFLFWALILFKKLETFYIIMAGLMILYIGILISYSLNKSYRKGKFKKFFINSILSVIFTLCFSIGGYLMYKVYGTLNEFSKDVITYKTSLITLNKEYTELSKVKKSKIGMVSDENDLELYTLPMEVIEKNKLSDNNEIVKYNSVVDLLNALYDEEVDLIFVNGNYIDLFTVLEEYSNIEEKTFEVDSYSKDIEKVTVEDEKTLSDSKMLTEPFTILLLGVDSEEDGLNKNAAFNGDTLMLVTFNPKTLNATMFSIPRDTYVKIACGNRQVQKINTSAYGGTSCVIKTIQNMTGINIDYYAKINFKGVVNLVDALGGINVEVPYSFCEQNSNREWAEHTIYVESGMQNLNGEQALALSRNRKTNSDCDEKWNVEGPRNDFIRGKNQQLVVEGMLNQVKNIKSANTLMEILDIVNKNIDTNLSTDQILSFYDIVKNVISAKSIDVVNIQKTFLRGYDMYVYEPSAKGTRYAFFNWKGSLDAIVKLMETNLGKNETTIVKEFSFSANTNYEKELVGDKNYNEAKVSVVPNFSNYSFSEVKSWGKSNGITMNILDNETKSAITGNESNYSYVSQSVHEKTMVIKAGDSIDLYYKSKKVVAPVVEETEEPEEAMSSME